MSTIARVLGQDDWLIFARTADGRLVYIVIECDPTWLSAPHEGDAIYGSREWRADNAFMQEHVTRNADSYHWRECDRDTDGTRLDWPVSEDDGFAARAAAHYLPISGGADRDALYRNAVTYAALNTGYGSDEAEDFAQAYAESYAGIPEPPSPGQFRFYRQVREDEPPAISAVWSPSFDDYASGKIPASEIICALCQRSPCECPEFGSPEYFALMDRVHGRHK